MCKWKIIFERSLSKKKPFGWRTAYRLIFAVKKKKKTRKHRCFVNFSENNKKSNKKIDVVHFVVWPVVRGEKRKINHEIRFLFCIFLSCKAISGVEYAEIRSTLVDHKAVFYSRAELWVCPPLYPFLLMYNRRCILCLKISKNFFFVN